MRHVSVSIDLDEVPCYTEIHGLPDAPPSAANAVYRKSLPRYQKLFDELHIRATFFVVGRDLGDPQNASLVAELARQGHEIANHTANHYYDLIRRDKSVLRDEIAECADTIQRVTQIRPRGFRAPGYSVSNALFEVLEDLSVTYDSSLLPCPLYYGAKALAMASIWAAGRRSRSILYNPLALTCPTQPYRVDKPYWRRGKALLEIPISVTPALSGRLPYIGTTLVLSGIRGAKWLSQLMVGTPFVNLELHGIDLADADLDNLAFLRDNQPDLRKSLAAKEHALRAALNHLRQNGYSFVTLSEIASRLDGESSSLV
jgi:peptidoglycan/xylan/chitin deacetylase (PgdA/CDA1 family)